MSILAMILAGGQASGLGVLTALRSEAAVPFGGKYRIIDFTLSNCVNSGIYNVAVLTQYEPRSLNEHIGIGRPWDLDRAHGGIRILHPFQSRRGVGAWQEGNADAVRFNLDSIAPDVEHVLILSGDHIYKMDYSPLLAFHAKQNADVTVAVRPVNPHEAYRFGMIGADNDGRILSFEEKPKRTRSTLASMGVYVFRRELLAQWLLDGGRTQHDFGREVIPSFVERDHAWAFPFQGYWDDVGTIQSYWEANMALLAETPALDLYASEWVIHTRSEERPAAQIGAEARVDGNLLCDGCRIEGHVAHSVISAGVYVAPGAVVRDSIIMNDALIGPDAVIERAIIDKRVLVGAGVHIGDTEDNTPNQNAPQRLNTGITLIGKSTHLPANLRIGRNVEIAPNLPENVFTSPVPSGATIQAGRSQ